MLPNRVDPFGNITSNAARGTFMGNRGVIHDEDKQIVRRYQLKAWLICLLSFKGRSLPVMEPRHNTQLFFLDEAVAFSAGHRPCACCRREAFNDFKKYWIAGNKTFNFDKKVLIGSIDSVLHSERTTKTDLINTIDQSPSALPSGTFIANDGKAYLVKDQLLYPWSYNGYEEPLTSIPATYSILTPVSVVNMFAAGYLPIMNLPE